MSDSWQDSDFSFGPFETEVETERQTRKRRFVRKVYHIDTGAYVGETGLIFPLLCTIVGIILLGMGIAFFITFEGDEAYGALFASWVGSFAFGFMGYYGLSAYFTGKVRGRSGGGSGSGPTDLDMYGGGDLPDGF